MSETQVKVTGSFKAVDNSGNHYSVTEYSIFRKTTTADMALGTGEGEESKLKIRYFRTTPLQADGAFARKFCAQSSANHEFFVIGLP